MKDKTTHLYVDSHERTLILHSLVELKNALIRQGRYTDCIGRNIQHLKGGFIYETF